MHGEIYLRSVFGEGSEFGFTLSLPLANAEDIPNIKRLQKTTSFSDFPQLKGHILLVEDIPTNQKVAASILKKIGLSVVIANDGLEAIELWKQHEFDLIFMDCLMPNMDGFEATQNIREQEAEGQRIPIIALTATVIESEKHRCLQVGMDAVLPKPFKVHELIKVLVGYLNDAAETLELVGPASIDAVEEVTTELADSNVIPSLDEETWQMMQEMLEEGFYELLACFIEDAEKMFDELMLAMAEHQTQEVKRISHSIKSSSANLGLLKLSELAKGVEHQAENDILNEAEIAAMCAEFSVVKPRLLITIKEQGE